MSSHAVMKIKLPFNQFLVDTMLEYSRSAQTVADVGYKEGINNKLKLHHLTYYTIREGSKLPAQLVCSSRDKACEVLKAVQKTKGSKPVFKKHLTIRYDARSFSFKPDVVSLSTIVGRIKLPITVPEHFRQYLDWEICSADLVYVKGKLYLCVVVAKDIPADNGVRTIVGVDVGINNLAVTSTARFYGGADVKRVKSKYRFLRGKLQSKGTRSARRRLKALSGKESRFMAWVNHNISKDITETINAGDVLVMEDLTDIRDRTLGRRMNYWLNSWAFYQLQSFLTYKTERKAAVAIKICPVNTSKRCSRCGSLHTSRNRGFFHCLDCDFKLNADLNAGRNNVQIYSQGITYVSPGAVTHPHSRETSTAKSPLL